MKLKKLLKEFNVSFTGMVNGDKPKKIELAKGWAHVVNERDGEGSESQNTDWEFHELLPSEIHQKPDR